MTNSNVTQLVQKTDQDRANEILKVQQMTLGILSVAENGATIEDITPLLDRLYEQTMLLSKTVVTV